MEISLVSCATESSALPSAASSILYSWLGVVSAVILAAISSCLRWTASRTFLSMVAICTS